MLTGYKQTVSFKVYNIQFNDVMAGCKIDSNSIV